MPIHSLEDLAKRLKVSRRTVSRVLREEKNVSPLLRERVARYLKREDYVPNAQASRLAAGRVPVVGLVFPESFLPSMDDYAARVIRGVLQAAQLRDHQVTFYAFKNLDLAEACRLHQGKRVGGLLFVAFGPSDFKALQTLRGRDVPVVSANLICPGVDSFDCDNVLGGYLAAKHLLEAGRKRVAFLHGDPGWVSSNDRFRGFKKALDEGGQVPRPELVQNAYYSMSAAHDAVLKMLGRRGARPDAIFAANDLMCMGAYAAVREHSLRVPEDVALIGFDDIPVCGLSILETTLSSIAQPLDDIARAATDRLMDLMESETVSAPIHRLFPPKLVVRESSGGAQPHRWA